MSHTREEVEVNTSCAQYNKACVTRRRAVLVDGLSTLAIKRAAFFYAITPSFIFLCCNRLCRQSNGTAADGLLVLNTI